MSLDSSKLRNLAFCGHGSAGKTTLIEALLAHCHAVAGDAHGICDFDELEKEHHHTIEAKVVHFDHAGITFQVLDTPGYPDFIGQTISALRAVETACIVVNGHAGVEVNTRRTFQEAGKRGLGRIIIIDKMDDEQADFAALVSQVKDVFGAKCVPVTVPIGVGAEFSAVANTLKPSDGAGAVMDLSELNTELIEAIVEVDEGATERYFEGVVPEGEELDRLAQQAVAEGSVIPIFAVSAKTGAGIAELLDLLAEFALPPDGVHRKARRGDEEVDLPTTADGPLAALVFRTRIDPFVQKLSFVRVFSGTLHKDDSVHLSGHKKDVKIGPPLLPQASEMAPIDSAPAGAIVAIAKMEDLHTGMSLGEFDLPPIQFPRPMVGLSFAPKSRGDESKLSVALHKIEEEDSTINIQRDEQTHELVIQGMSDLHLQLIQERLKMRDHVEVETHEPKIPYRETIQAESEGSYRHKKQSGGRGQFGEVHIRMFPFPPEATPEEFATKARFPQMREYRFHAPHHFLWVDSIVGGSIPNNFLPAVEKGFIERMTRGVIAGHQVENVAVEVHYGKHHPVDSSEAAFKTAGSMAFRDVFQKAQPALLEPVVTLHITAPSANLGDVNSDLSGRRGRVLGMDSAGSDMQVITAEAPLAEVGHYARTLSSITGGQGSYTMEFARYEIVPGNVQKEIMDKAVLGEEED